MHELSIACSIVDTIQENIPDAHSRVSKVNLKIGTLSGVVKDALLFSFEIAAADTRVAGAVLEIEEVPLVVHCGSCDKDSDLGAQPVFRCGHCGTPTGDIVSGKELEIVSFEVEDGKAANS